jgi:hypothetical protein
VKGLTLTGGLGDAFIAMHETDGYDALNRLRPDERARVYIISHNPFVPEIFHWHPYATQIDVFTSSHFFLNFTDPAERARGGIPPEPIDPAPTRPRTPVQFWPSPKDFEVLELSLPREPYLVVAPTASGMEIENRNLPLSILTTALAHARIRRIPAVLVGRTYNGPHAPKAAPPRPSGPGIVDLTDRLSVPGTVEVVKRARAILSAHSCMLLVAWYERLPNFLALPPKYEWHDFLHTSPFGFGKDYPESTRVLFENYRPQMFADFLGRSFR